MASDPLPTISEIAEQLPGYRPIVFDPTGFGFTPPIAHTAFHDDHDGAHTVLKQLPFPPTAVRIILTTLHTRNVFSRATLGLIGYADISNNIRRPGVCQSVDVPLDGGFAPICLNLVDGA